MFTHTLMITQHKYTQNNKRYYQKPCTKFSHSIQQSIMWGGGVQIVAVYLSVSGVLSMNPFQFDLMLWARGRRVALHGRWAHADGQY
jgi:hypothetical protein